MKVEGRSCVHIIRCAAATLTDSRLNCPTTHDRLFSENTPYGFIPGAAAVILRLSRGRSRSSVPEASIIGAEPVTEYAQGESAFAALSDVCFAACNQASVNGKVIDCQSAEKDLRDVGNQRLL